MTIFLVSFLSFFNFCQQKEKNQIVRKGINVKNKAEQTFRGSSWRGLDCDDYNNAVYAGRKNTTLPVPHLSSYFSFNIL